MRRRPTLGSLCLCTAALAIGFYLEQTTFADNFCRDYRQGCVTRGSNGYGVLLAILAPALVLIAAGCKLIWDDAGRASHPTPQNVLGPETARFRAFRAREETLLPLLGTERAENASYRAREREVAA
jgi:hypothetical protein